MLCTTMEIKLKEYVYLIFRYLTASKEIQINFALLVSASGFQAIACIYD